MLKFAAIVTLLTLTACREERPRLPVVQAAISTPEAPHQKRFSSDGSGLMNHFGIDMQRIKEDLYRNGPPQYCYSFIRNRPRQQRADAVQARLAQADRMTAAFEPDLLTVELVGDLANILSLEFPVAGPD